MDNGIIPEPQDPQFSDNTVYSPAPKSKTPQVVAVILVILILVVLAILAMRHGKKTVNSPVEQTPNPTAEVQNNAPDTKVPALEITQAPPSGLPVGLPSGLPIEKNAQVLQSQTILNKDTGQHDANYMYVTVNTIDENLAAFTKYLSTNGWKISNSVVQENYQAINAKNGDTTMSVILDYKSAQPQNQVSINYKY